jgi:two-component system, OmpR family, sensor histidine kinase QseC
VDDAERRQALQHTLAGCDRATRLVEQLLTLSRLEAGAPLHTQALDLAVLARGVVADAAPAALARRQSIDLRAADGSATVQGDPTLLGVLVRNLVDNAVRHSPPGAQVHVAVERPDGGGARLVVEDSGPGLSDADRARLGERFFRPAGTEAPGSGLGWSIVRRLAQAHGARLAVSCSQRLSGLRVEVSWDPPMPAPA